MLGADLKPGDIPVVEAFANLMAIALDNARLLHSKEQAEEQYFLTRLKRATNALHQSEQVFRSTIEQSADGVLLIDQRAFVIEWNNSLEQITGWKREEMVGAPIWEAQFKLVPPENRTPGLLNRMKTAVLEFLSTGSPHPFAASCQSLGGEQKNGT